MSVETLKPKVTLFSYTKDPLACIALGIDAWHAREIPTDVRAWTDTQLEEKFRWLLKQPHQTPFEYVHFSFVIENVSRAFQTQLIRHRVGFSYSIQSLRVVSVCNFAERGGYTMPPTVIDKEAYHSAMLMIQDQYNAAVRAGEDVGDARGILPLNVHSPLTFACTYRALLGMLRQRMCVGSTTEDEWVTVAEQIRACLVKVHPLLADPMDCMCGRFKNGTGFCKGEHRPVTKDQTR